MRSAQTLRKAEATKNRPLPVPGKTNNFLHTAMVDETYIVMANHVDESTIVKIQNGEYVDFGKLIPKNRALVQEDQRLEIVIKGGKSYYVPINETSNITNYTKWEQAFRVYCNIYTKAHPQRSSELIEYHHIIHTISQQFVWEHVYLYDKDFRIHMSPNPNRNWGVILQQAWSLHLRDRNSYGNHNHSNSSYGGSPNNLSSNSDNSSHKRNEPCRRYNRGKCSAGAGRRYDHRCSYCFKIGHSILTCRKLKADQDRLARLRREANGQGHSHGEEKVDRCNSHGHNNHSSNK